MHTEFPHTRLRRTRERGWSRRMLAESRLSVDDLIWPVFVAEDGIETGEVPALPGVHRYSLGELRMQAQRAWQLGIPAIALFPVIDPAKKDETGSEATNPDNLICQAVKLLKDSVPELGVICDVALDPYTSHGQDGIVEAGRIINDATNEQLVKQSILLAQAGCDVLAPSDMMDGRIGAIRSQLEAEGFHHTMILSYAAKYDSAFYGPFRDAVGSQAMLAHGSKASYQMHAANSDEALREVALDVAEGADMVMVKPAMPYLDIVRRVSQQTSVPVLAYQVSGEYAMLRHAAHAGAFDYERAMLEALLGIKRAGGRAIFTYAAIEVAEWLQG